MAIYIGIQSNAGKFIDNDADALAYAFTCCGIQPYGGWNHVDKEFCSLLLEWFFSGDWLCIPSC